MGALQSTPVGNPESNSRFLLCSLSREIFAIPLNPVKEIIRTREPVSVPLSPEHVAGIINLRGEIIPLVSMQSVLRLDPDSNSGILKAVILETAYTAGIIVDNVINVVEISPEAIEPVEKELEEMNGFFIKGTIRTIEKYPLVLILDVSLVMSTAFENILQKKSVRKLQNTTQEEKKNNNVLNEDQSQFVSFTISNQEYAVPLNHVLEIMEMPENVVHVPNVHNAVLGLVSLRNRFIPLLDIRKLFGFAVSDKSSKSRVIILETAKTVAGIVVDSVSEILTVDTGSLDKLPGILTENEELEDIISVCRLDNGKRVISILSVEKLTKYAVMKEVLESVEEAQRTQSMSDSSGTDSFEQVIIFILNGNEFGVPITSVQEIVRIPEILTSVPQSPDFIEGVMNLRGTVVPVIDQRKRMGLPAAAKDDRQRIMVFSIDGVRTGFIVDAVTEVLKIPENLIDTAPRLSNEQSRILDRVANLEKEQRIIQLLNPDFLMEDEAITMLKEIEIQNEDTDS